MSSITRQLSVGLAVTLILLGVVVAQLSVWQFDRALRTLAERELALAAERVFAAIERGPDGPILDTARLDAVFARPDSGHYFTVHDDDQVWRSRSLWDDELSRPDAPGLEPALVAGPAAQQLLVLRADVKRYGHDFVVVVASDQKPALDQFAHTVRWLLAIWSAGLIALTLVQWWWVRRALRPLDAARAQIEQLQSGDRPLVDESSARELVPLLRQINALLDHTRRSVERSRASLGDLGHALKTPLAVLGALTERDSVRADADLRRQLVAQVETIRRQIGRALGKARVAGETPSTARFHPSADLPLLIESVRRAHDRPLEVACDVRVEGPVPFDRDDLLELIGNLVDNAAKWAAGRVQLRIGREGHALEITVDDDGPGIEDAEQARVLERGVRLDERSDGHGLGLAIVRDVVEVHGGTLDLRRSQLGGLGVRVVLPWPRPA